MLLIIIIIIINNNDIYAILLLLLLLLLVDFYVELKAVKFSDFYFPGTLSTQWMKC